MKKGDCKTQSPFFISYVLELSLSDKAFFGTLKTWAVTYCGSQPIPVMQAYLQNFKLKSRV